MSEELKLFGKIPYEVRTLDTSFLSIEQAEEALNDLFSDTESMLELPPLDEILKVANDNMFGFYRLNVTIYKNSTHPEYMLTARVAELEPTLINIIFEPSDDEKPASLEKAPEIEPVVPEIQTTDSEGKLDIIQFATQKLGMNYETLGKEIGYSGQTLNLSVSSGDISKPLTRAIELYLENIALKKEVENSSKVKTALKEWLK